jgi:hypothetical protein
MATRAEITKLCSMMGTADPRYALSRDKLAQAVEV